jgi:hypothetical protein
VQKGNHEITSKRGAQGSKSLISSAWFEEKKSPNIFISLKIL